MTKALTYVEIDLPDTRCVVHLAFEGFEDIIDNNPALSPHVWTMAGGVDYDGDFPPFGDSDVSFDGSGRIFTPDSPDFTFGDGDFNIEFYFWKNVATGTERNFCGQRLGVAGANSTRSFNIDIDTTGHVRGLVFQGTTQVAATGTTVFGVSTAFHHVSFNRLGSNLLLFIDGVLEATTAITGAINDSAGSLAIGQDGDDTNSRWNGWMDEFTICRFARRTANFEVDASNYPLDSTANLLPPLRTFRFAIDAAYLPKNIDAIPSMIELKIDPAIISLGETIGQRATVTATFRDHRHIFDTDSFSVGTFWGKFRARYGLRLQGYPLRVINGAVGQTLDGMETRHFAIESSDGPNDRGEYEIVAKDILKFADGDRSQAPVLSSGFLNADITAGATNFTIAPPGIGNRYPTSGAIAIGGSEIAFYTRSGDTFTFTDRGDFNTDTVAHNAQDRVQLCIFYDAVSVDDILFDLLVNYADVPAIYIDEEGWAFEASTYLNTVYTALIAEPVAVADLISELIEQVGLVLWWDDIAQQIKLQVLKPVASNAEAINADIYMAGSFRVVEQPEKRLSQVYTYFAKRNPLVNEDQIDNYRSNAISFDGEAEAAYGSPAIKKIFSRWITDGAHSVAASLNDILLGRFRDPPRRISFNILRGSGLVPALAAGYQIAGLPFQQRDGTPAMVPAQVTRLNPRADFFEVELEEISTTLIAMGSPGVHEVIIDSSINNVNLRSMHDSIYGTPVSGNEVRCTVNSGVVVGSTSVAAAAFNVGTWPSGVSVSLTVNGRLQGMGGSGAAGSGSISSTGGTGQAGGTALLTRKAITLISASAQIWGGGGGGGGGGSVGNLSGQPVNGGSGGGGGSGTNAGAGGPGGAGVQGNGNPGVGGTPTSGGSGGGQVPLGGGPGGAGGGPGLAGAAGTNGLAPIHTNGGVAGLAGAAIDGISFVTTSGGAGDRRGGQIN